MIILDSNIWIAFVDRSDQTHARAVNIINDIDARGDIIGMPEYVILEATTMINRLAGKEKSDEFLQYLFDNEKIEVLPSSAGFLHEVVRTYLSYTTKKLSFTDISLLALAREVDVYTFDKNLETELRRRQ